MKMITFNVNGLRASIGHGLMEYLKAENPDVICLQETKCVIKIILKKNIKNNFIIIMNKTILIG